MIPWLPAVFAASLLGSLHCAGMCGGFACFVAGQGERRWLPQACYHAGRLATYLTLGALAGTLGVGIDRLGHAAGVARMAAVASGLVLVLWGGASLAVALGAHLPRSLARPWPRVPVAPLLRRAASRPVAMRAILLGALTTLLPCGWLWAFVTGAAATGSALGGIAVMAAFWLGTVPALLGVGLLAGGALAPLRRRLPLVTAAAMLVMGLLVVAGKLEVGGAAAFAGAPGTHGCH